MPAGVVHAKCRPIACLGLHAARQADAIETLIRNTPVGSPPLAGRDCWRIKANMLVLVMMVQSLWRQPVLPLWVKNIALTPIPSALKAIHSIADMHSLRLAPIHAPLPPPLS